MSGCHDQRMLVFHSPALSAALQARRGFGKKNADDTEWSGQWLHTPQGLDDPSNM